MEAKIIWTDALRDAAVALATTSDTRISRDVVSRATEMRSMQPGTRLTEAQVEFITCLRQRFGFRPAPEEAAFEAAYGEAFDIE